MAILACDLGNTKLQLGIYDPSDTRLQVWKLDNQPPCTAEEYGEIITQMTASFAPIQYVGISSVVPALETTLLQAFQQAGWTVAVNVKPAHDQLLPMEIEIPQDLGADRAIGSWMAYQKYGAPLIIVDCGTAATVEVINNDGVYLGGPILPGTGMAAQSLSTGTAQLPTVTIKKPTRLMGKNTVECIQSGIYYGWQDMLGGLVKRICDELNLTCPVVGTGGGLAIWEHQLEWCDYYEPYLVLDGVAHLIKRRTEI